MFDPTFCQCQYDDGVEIQSPCDNILNNPFYHCSSTDDFDLIEFSPINKPKCAKKRVFEVEVIVPQEDDINKKRRFSITKTKPEVGNLFNDAKMNEKKSRISVEVSLS